MITIQSGMLVALGFLVAVLFCLLVAPAFWARAVRLTTRRIKEAMPLSEMEIEADRDRIRAEYAIKMHKLETLVEQVKMAGARQQIEINRRDAKVNVLESDLERLRANHEEAQNARRVLELTIADRLPRVETRLTDAKKLLHSREREIDDLTRTADRQMRALAEASSINAQQQGEIERLSTSLSARVVRASESSGQRSEREVALRAELEALRGKTREQAQLLARMQSLAGRPSGPLSPGRAADEAEESANASQGTTNGRDNGSDAARVGLEKQIRNLRASNDDQAAEMARLKAAIAVFEQQSDGDAKMSIRESRIALKARVQSLEAQSTQQAETIQKLRGELAAANERLARQATHFTGELRRLGTGGSGASVRGRRAATDSPRTSLADRVAQARSGPTAPPSAAEDTDASSASRPQVVADARAPNGANEPPAVAAKAEAREAERAKPAAAAVPAEASKVDAPAAAVTPIEAANRSAKPEGDKEKSKAAAPGDVDEAKPGSANRPRLLDRIAGLSRS